jgi:vancomycin resistance protein VanW
MGKRKLFCEICPLTYRISQEKEILKRHLSDLLHRVQFAQIPLEGSLEELIYQHKSLIRRRLGNVDMELQENKAVNLSLAVKHLDGIVIRPGETFSLWWLVTSSTQSPPQK